jgi:DNA-binding LytR/AlgR family response regulator
MATNSNSKGQIKALNPRFTIHQSDENLAVLKIDNRNFMNADYLKALVLENPSPMMALLNTFWQEAEKLVDLTLAKKSKEPRIDSLFIKANDQIINLRLSEILWVEAYGDYVNFFTEKTRYLVHSTMKGIETKLPTDQFARVHRSFIVRPDKIDLIEESLIQIGKKLIPIGESYRNELMARLNIL